METIQIRYGLEDLVSRLPGMFPYLEFCEDGTTRAHSAKDSLNGCYGHVVCGIRIPEGVELVADGTTLIESGGVYSYRTLMLVYHEYKDRVGEEDTFMPFMERCIGRYRIDADIDYSECYLVPEYGYYAESYRLYSEYTTMKLMCEAYESMKEATGEINCDLECLVERYNRMGGDDMLEYYKEKVAEFEEESDWIFDNCADTEQPTLDIQLNLVSRENDLGMMTAYLDEWVPSREYGRGDIVLYDGSTYVCTCEEGETTSGVWDSTTDTVVFDHDNFELITESYDSDPIDVSATTESQLATFKDGKSYLDEGGLQLEPGIGEDWLWYYKVGSVSNSGTVVDGIGNIMVKEGCERSTDIGGYETNLLAYGDVLTGIECDAEGMKVTFTYVIGANLKAVLTAIETDSNGDTRYYYNNYAYNSDDTHGIVYTETHPFTGDMSEIQEIIDNGKFNDYVTGDVIDYLYYKCPFDVSMTSEDTVILVNGLPQLSSHRIAGYTTIVGETRDSLGACLTRDDYLVGVTMQPSVDVDVFINRGNSTAWERHMKLGEVKTFEDLENYANGGFFNLI